MTNAGPTSTHSASDSAEHADSQPIMVAVSEENLAALMRATDGSAELEAQHDIEDAEVPTEATAERTGPLDAGVSAPPISEPASPSPAPSPQVAAVENRLALFAKVKEHRSAILRSGAIPAAPLLEQPPSATTESTAMHAAPQYEDLAASPPAKVFPSQMVPPRPRALVQEPAPPTATPLRTPVERDRIQGTPPKRLLIGLVVGAVIAIASISLFLTRTHRPKAPEAAAALKSAPAPQQQLEAVLPSETSSGMQTGTRSHPGEQTDTLKPQNISKSEATAKTQYQETAKALTLAAPAAQRTAEERAIADAPPILLNGPASRRAGVQESAALKLQDVPKNNATTEAPQPNPAKARIFAPPAVPRTAELHAILDAPPALPNATLITPGVSLPASLTPISPPPPVSNGVQQPVRVESRIQLANLIRKVNPIYPPLAKSGGVQGTVRFTAVVGKDGRIQNLKVISGTPLLVESARAAIKQWIYRPTLLNGQPIEVLTQIDLTFTLDGNLR